MAKYTITLDNQGANVSAGTSQVTVVAGNNMTAIAIPSKRGYTFGGYYTSPKGEGTQYYSPTGASARAWDDIDSVSRTGTYYSGTGTATLYAKWDPITYNLSYELHGGRFKEDIVSRKRSEKPSSLKGRARFVSRYNVETEYIILEDPERKGTEFKGWKKTVR